MTQAELYVPDADQQSARPGGGLDPGYAAGELRRLVEVAASEPELSQGLALSRTVVRLRVSEDPRVAVTVHLEPERVEASEGDAGEAESEILIASADLLAFVRGELQLPIAIAKGRVSYTGCVRKFLRAAPILRRAARLEAGRDGQAPVGEGTQPVDE